MDPLTFALRGVEQDDDMVTLIGVVIWWRDELKIGHALRPARETHVSWREHGEANGTSGEAVRQRYHAF